MVNQNATIEVRGLNYTQIYVSFCSFLILGLLDTGSCSPFTDNWDWCQFIAVVAAYIKVCDATY